VKQQWCETAVVYESIVVVMDVTDGAAGVLPKPNVTGGVTGVSEPRSSHCQDATTSTTRCWCLAP